MSLDSHILTALSEILAKGDKHITAYKLANHIGLDTTIVYRRLKLLREKKNV